MFQGSDLAENLRLAFSDIPHQLPFDNPEWFINNKVFSINWRIFVSNFAQAVSTVYIMFSNLFKFLKKYIVFLILDKLEIKLTTYNFGILY